ncbi:MAG: hypothetical protein GWP03_01115 [Proteobacteria bacterium]|nr:hypothetical protein [Pseudomonadota bacterium]
MDFAFGNYVEGTSVIHKMNPTLKILLFFIIFIIILFIKHIYTYLIILFLVSTAGMFLKLPVKKLFYSIRYFIWLLLFTVFFNFFMVPGKVIFTFYSLNGTYEGLLTGTYYGLRIIVIMFFAGIFAMVTSPEELENAIVVLLKPFSLFKFPVGETSFMFSLTLRFVPIISEETRRIITAQKLRGAKFEGNLTERIKSLSTVLIPLIYSLFKRADEIANVMESRFVNPHEIVVETKKIKKVDFVYFFTGNLLIFVLFLADRFIGR